MKTFALFLLTSLALQACLVPSMAFQTSTATLAISRPLAAAGVDLVPSRKQAGAKALTWMGQPRQSGLQFS